MSTQTPHTPESQPTATEIATRRGEDPWATAETLRGTARSVARSQRQFEPTSLDRMRNLIDDENAYSA